MKLVQKKKVFHPVSVILETYEELRAFRGAIAKLNLLAGTDNLTPDEQNIISEFVASDIKTEEK